MTAPRSALDVHIGAWPPARWDEIDDVRVTKNPGAWGTQERPLVTSEAIDWEALHLTPRWVGDDSSEAVAALEPSRFHDRGAQEWQRFREGTRSRGEVALAVSTLRPASDPRPVALGRVGDAVSLPGADGSSVGGEQIALRSRPEAVATLNGADRDLALRLKERSTELPWWRMELSGSELYRAGSYPERVSPDGLLMPLLVSAVGEVVAAVWIAPDGALRHYVVPFMPSYVPLLDWLVERAVPEFVPAAARRLRGSLGGEPLLQTADEAAARKALSEFEAAASTRRGELQAQVDDSVAQAEEVRDPLLYGSGSTLVVAVRRVLSDAGVDVVDVDELLGDTTNADLLASFRGRRLLVEVKASSGNPSEALADAPTRHLRTWAELRPDLPVDGVALVLNHQTRNHPLDRAQHAYARPEFVASLSFPVLTTKQLVDWWRVGDFEGLRSALFGRDGASSVGTQDDTQQQVAIRRIPWRRRGTA